MSCTIEGCDKPWDSHCRGTLCHEHQLEESMRGMHTDLRIIRLQCLGLHDQLPPASFSRDTIKNIVSNLEYTLSRVDPSILEEES